MIRRFEVDKYYRYIGPKRRNGNWNNKGKMDYVLDGEPRKATVVSPVDNDCAAFEGDPDKNHVWFWGDLSRFEEVPSGFDYGKQLTFKGIE